MIVRVYVYIYIYIYMYVCSYNLIVFYMYGDQTCNSLTVLVYFSVIVRVRVYAEPPLHC